MKRFSIIPLAVLAFPPLTDATAQVQQPPVERGTRVRLTVPRPCTDPYTRCTGRESRRNVGTFLAWKADSLVMESEGDTLAVPQRLVRKLEVSTGRGPTGENTAQGVLLGALAGTAIGLAIATAATPKEKECRSFLGGPEQHKTCIEGGALIGLLGGALVGAMIGAGFRGDRWQEVPLDRVRVSFGPQRDGRLGVGASVRF